MKLNTANKAVNFDFKIIYTTLNNKNEADINKIRDEMCRGIESAPNNL